MKNLLSIVILTYNEEKNISKCLHSLKTLNANVYIVDSFSNDSTEDIAKSFGVHFVQNKFETHVKQWQFALSLSELNTEWVLGLDADQELTAELAKEIKETLIRQPNENGFYLNRRNYFLNKWIKHGGYYPRYLLKLFRKDCVYLDENEMMDHHFYVRGSTRKLQYDIIENNLKEDLSFWINKHNKYASLQAKEEFNKLEIANGNFFGNQDEKRLFLKKIWNKSPLFIRPFVYFIYRYFIQLGFIDGKKGLIFHFLQAFWYRFLVDAKIYEMRKQENVN
ncbi:glycosyltransferase family 2 protein [Pedobacter arcticus]|uniref:glycosyltransferase family 2 protein n=1 Tax=Pedobacter arcticus TaxID=752140 RepID=UPI000318BDD9|nr:glycosyltransferase family 2 protein [Pedobacter arcticus]